MISASVTEILPFKAFEFLAIHADISHVICGPKEHQFYNEMYHQSAGVSILLLFPPNAGE